MHAKRMMFLVSSVLFFAFSFVPVFAQENEDIPDPEISGEEMKNIVVIATVNITQSEVVRQQDGVLEVKYTVSNREGIQTDIRASLGLLDAKNAMVEEQRENAVFSLRENEEKVRTITMEIPAFLKGEFTPVVSLATEAGLPLSFHIVGEKIMLSGTSNEYVDFQGCFLTVTGDEKKYFAGQGVDVAANEELLAHCSAQNMSAQSQTVTPSIAEYRRSSFGKKMNEYKVDPVTFASSEKKEIVFTVVKNSEPQAYTQKVALLNENGKKVSNETSFHYVLQGESATIQNIVLDKNAYKKGEVATITFTSTGSADGFMESRKKGGTPLKGSASLRITDGNGTLCAEQKTISFGEKVFQKETITLEKDCSNPSVFASIQNNEGKVLDSREVSVNNPSSEHKESAAPIQKNEERGDKKMQYFFFVGIGIFITLIGLVIIFLKKIRSKNRWMGVFFGLFFTMGILGMAESANADTFSLSDYTKYEGPYNVGYGLKSVTMDVGREFAPGAAISVGFQVNETLCRNAYFHNKIGYKISGETSMGIILDEEYDWSDSSETYYPTPYTTLYKTAQTKPGSYKFYFSGYSYHQHCHSSYGCPSWLKGTERYSFSVPYSVQNPYSCIGLDPPFATLCSGDNLNLSANTPKTLVASCTTTAKCEYTCKTGYTFFGGICHPDPTPNLHINGSKDATVLLNADVKFQWSTDIGTCTITPGGFPQPLPPSPILKKASVGMTATYTLTCKNPITNVSKSDTAHLTVKCTPSPGTWSGCPECSNTDTTEIRTGVDADCKPVSERRACNIPQCQPGGFQEVKP